MATRAHNQARPGPRDSRPEEEKFCYFAVTPEGCFRGFRCKRRHDIVKCSCGLVLLKEYEASHIRGQRHRELFQQERGRQAAAAASGVDPNETKQCERCNKTFLVSRMNWHMQYHARKDRRDAYQAVVAQAEEDKEGVVVTCREGVDFGVVEPSDNEVAAWTTVEIYNTCAEYDFAINACRMRSSTRGDPHGQRFSAVLNKKRKLRANSHLQVAIGFHPGDAGTYEDTLELVFWHYSLRRTFVIIRKVTATVGDKEDHEILQPSAPYTGPKEITRVRIDPSRIIASLRPSTWTKTSWTDKLGEFPIPKQIIDAVFGPQVKPGNAARSKVKELMPAALNLMTYKTWWQVLLWIEEEQTRLDLDRYALFNEVIKPDYPRYILQVPGLAENRPSVLVGDYINVSEANEKIPLELRNWHQGRVQTVRMNEVVLTFDDSFNTYKGNRFDVRFVLNRLPFRRMHQAIANNCNPQPILFPMPNDIVTLKRPTEAQMKAVKPYDRHIPEDEEQLETVTAILNRKPGSVPFVVFGPPGTGKTVTIIEAMKQLLDKDPSVKILACAPSNSAADLLAQKLADRGRTVVFRLNSLTRKRDDLPKNLVEFSCINENNVFTMPLTDDLRKFRVIVATCLSGGVVSSLGIARGHFSHIFIDEAGQGKEPEVMVPIKSLAGPKTNIVLAGDNQQLGPIVHSNIAAGLGLKTSYLARLMDRDVYDLEVGRGKTIVKLVKNFRSHPDILQFSNEQFYRSELQPCGDPAMIRSLETVEELPKKRFPIIFHGIVGKDQREASSPSFFNIEEASQVKKYCLALLDNRKYRLTAEHIGVITPYHAQRCKILDLLHKDQKTKDIKVGSVEEFQGQERRVIIMCTVRSNTEYIASDITRSLGFVANSRRMNVAITRAQALLVVIGNPIVLSLDPLWRSFLNFIYVRGGWRGKAIDWDPVEPVQGDSIPGSSFEDKRRQQAEREMQETIERLKALIVQRHEDSDVELDLDDVDGEDEDEGGAGVGEAMTAYERPILREAE